MFERIELKGLSKSKMFGYAAALPFFNKRKVVELKPGINILFGGNGVGKSTILRILADTMCSRQAGHSAITKHALDTTVDSPFSGTPRCGVGLKVVHDGQPVVFCDPRDAEGHQDGRVDDEFMLMGLNELFDAKTLSHGQKTNRRLGRVLATIVGDAPHPKSVEYKVSRGSLNSVWKSKLDIVEARMAASIDKGQPTVLLDEPESCLSLKSNAGLWRWMMSDPDVHKNRQLVVATHSVFALGIPGANYTELTPGSTEEATTALFDKVERLRTK